jgi:hypothetical protein
VEKWKASVERFRLWFLGGKAAASLPLVDISGSIGVIPVTREVRLMDGQLLEKAYNRRILKTDSTGSGWTTACSNRPRKTAPIPM